jgi:hypothetical protein
MAGIAILAILAVSCRTLSPLTTPAEILAVRTPAELQPRWEPFAEETGPGLAYFAGKIQEPRLELWALRIDLDEPGLEVVVNSPEGEGPPGHIPSTTVSGFVRRYGCLGGINAGPFSPVSGREGEDRTIVGLAVAGGVLVAPPEPAYDALVFFVDPQDGGRRAAILPQENLDLTPVLHAVGGFRIVLEHREIPPAVYERGDARHPRSAAGLSEGGRFLYLLAVDGRRPGSVGATEAELAAILRQLGAVDGLNFDGGGSTSLALRFSDHRVRPVNTPIHRQIPGWERGVASCLGIRRVEP